MQTFESTLWKIKPENGFLPSIDPLEKLPSEFNELETLMQELPY